MTPKQRIIAAIDEATDGMSRGDCISLLTVIVDHLQARIETAESEEAEENDTP